MLAFTVSFSNYYQPTRRTNSLQTTSRYNNIVPWGKHKTSEDPEDEAYAADIERQMQTERDREKSQSHTQLRPQAMPNPYDKAEVTGRECGSILSDSLREPHVLFA